MSIIKKIRKHKTPKSLARAVYRKMSGKSGKKTASSAVSKPFAVTSDKVSPSPKAQKPISPKTEKTNSMRARSTVAPKAQKPNHAPSTVHFLDRISILEKHVFLPSPRIATRVTGLVEHFSRNSALLVFQADSGNLVHLGMRDDDFVTFAKLAEVWFETPIGWQGKGFKDLQLGDKDFERKIAKSDKLTAKIHFGDVVNISIVVNLYQREEDKTTSQDNKNADLRFIRGVLQDLLDKPGLHYVENVLGGNSAQAVTFPIDVVYTWVNNEDPDWQEIYAAAKAERDAELLAEQVALAEEADVQTAEPAGDDALTGGVSPDTPLEGGAVEPAVSDDAAAATNDDGDEEEIEEATDTAAMSRFKNRQELKYSLRSIEQYMPWVRKIFVFTNCAKPSWLEETDNLVWVRHEDVIPAKNLPTFNSHAIESYLHKIPDLSEHFIYFNDDFFVNQPLSIQLFFTANGVAQSNLEDYGVVNGPQVEGDADYLNAARNGVDLLRKEFGMVPTRLHKHSPYAMSKSVMAEMEKKFKDGFARTRAGKFRSSTDLSTASFLFHHYGYATRAVAYGGFRAKLVKNTARNLEADFKMMVEGTTVRTFCLNDGNDSHDDERWNTMISEFLEARFPLVTRAEMGLASSELLETDQIAPAALPADNED